MTNKPNKVEEMYNELTKFAVYHRRNGERFVELADKDVKDFLRQSLTSSYEQGVIEGMEQSRVKLISVLDEVEKEHGSKNVYLDMVEELFTEEIDKALKNN